MRKFFFCIGIAAVILTSSLVACVGYTGYVIWKMNNEASAYANAAVVAITSKWDADALLTRATPDLTRGTDASHVRLVFDRFESLGPLVKSEDCKGSISVLYNPARKTIVNSAYVCTAAYERHPATIKMSLTKRDGRWMINSFWVDSPIFAAPTVRKA